MRNVTRVAVAAPNQIAVEAGLDVGRSGGNAVDAAVAAVVAASVTEPGIVTPMGGAFVNVWPASGDPAVVDGNVEMPGRGLPPDAFGTGVEQFDMEYGGGITVHAGHGSVATPGMFQALADAHERWGAVPWAELISPAVAAVRDGYPLGAPAAYYLTYSGTSLFHWHEQTRAWMLQGSEDGVLPTAGQIMRSPDLADTLGAIAAGGVRELYEGDLARVIADDMAAHGGLITRADLAAYRTQVREPLRCRLGDWDVAVNPGPSIGGPVLTTMLRLLTERWDAHGVDMADLPAVQRHVLDYRFHHLDDAEDLEAAGLELMRIVEDEGLDGLVARLGSPNTIHVSAVDSDGIACSITTSAGYGSGVTTPGTGLMLNNALGEPELNRRGLHALPAGTRLASNMAPTTGRTADGRSLAIGSPGADRITTALLQVLSAGCLRGVSLREAVDAPRLHVVYDETGPRKVAYEADAALAAAAAGTGLPVEEFEGLHMFFGGVGACLRRTDGSLEAVGDPRRDAATGMS